MSIILENNTLKWTDLSPPLDKFVYSNVRGSNEWFYIADNSDVSLINLYANGTGEIYFTTPDTTLVVFDNIVTTLITDMNNTFYNCDNFNSPINSWDTSNVVDMTNMFTGATSFNQPLNNWNTSQVSSMFAMFKDATIFNQNISNWLVPLITSEPTDFSTNSALQNNYKPKWNGSDTFTTFSLSPLNIDEGINYIGTLTSDSTTTVNYTITNQTSNKLYIDGNLVKSTTPFNYNEFTSYNLEIKGDNGSNNYTLQFTITINDTLTTFDLSPLNVDEGVNYIGTLTSDSNTTTYSITNQTSNKLYIDGNLVKSTTPFNYNEFTSYNITIKATKNSTEIEKEFIITINNILTTFNLSPLNIDEGINYIGTLTNDSPNSVVYTIINQSGNNLYIDGNLVKSNNPFDYDITPSYDITISANDNYNIVVLSFTININQVQTQPSNILLSNSSIPANSLVNTLVGYFTTIDNNDYDTFTYTLVNGAGDSDNNYFKISGDQLLTDLVFDATIKTTYNIRVKTTDSTDKYYEKSFIITLLLPIANPQFLNAKIAVPKLITLTGVSVTGAPLIYEIVSQPVKGFLTQISNNQYEYLCSENGFDNFTFICKEDTMISNPATITLFNFFDDDINNFLPYVGLFEFTSVNFDGNWWYFGHIKTNKFFVYSDFTDLGFYQILNS